MTSAESAARKHVLVTGACSGPSIAHCLGVAYPELTIEELSLHDVLTSRGVALRESLGRVDAWFYLNIPHLKYFADEFAGVAAIPFPEMLFPAFHPDLIYASQPDTGRAQSAFHNCHSAIIVWSYCGGRSIDQTVASFNVETFAKLGYYDQWDASVEILKSQFEDCGLDFKRFFLSVKRRIPFMYTINHPNVTAFIELTQELVDKLPWRLEPCLDVTRFVLDHLRGGVWPIYPGIGERLGFSSGKMIWRLNETILNLREFVVECYKVYDEIGLRGIKFERLKDPRYAAALGE